LTPESKGRAVLRHDPISIFPGLYLSRARLAFTDASEVLGHPIGLLPLDV